MTVPGLKVVPFARLQAVLGALLGGVCGIIYSFGGLVYDLGTTGGVNLGTALAFMALAGMPLIFGAAGFLLGLAGALLYNLYSRKFRKLGLHKKI